MLCDSPCRQSSQLYTCIIVFTVSVSSWQAWDSHFQPRFHLCYSQEKNYIWKGHKHFATCWEYSLLGWGEILGHPLLKDKKFLRKGLMQILSLLHDSKILRDQIHTHIAQRMSYLIWIPSYNVTNYWCQGVITSVHISPEAIHL